MHLPRYILCCLDIVIVVNCWESTAEYSHIALEIKVCKCSVWILLKTCYIVFYDQVHLLLHKHHGFLSEYHILFYLYKLPLHYLLFA